MNRKIIIGILGMMFLATLVLAPTGIFNEAIKDLGFEED